MIAGSEDTKNSIGKFYTIILTSFSFSTFISGPAAPRTRKHPVEDILAKSLDNLYIIITAYKYG